MQGQKDVEEDFEQRWDALKPNPSTRQATVSHSSFPILDQFAEDAMRQEIDEVLTVTETSKGLSFEYVWEAAKHDHYDGSHGRSGMDTTLNYHSMFFPVSSEDIQAHFPDPVARASASESSIAPSGIPGIVPVFDAHKPSNGNEYYIQLEEQGVGTVGEGGNREGGLDFSSGRQDFVVLQDVRLDESSTDADFFHQSIDSKDSYLPDSHIWSSLENDSPYHTNIFTDEASKHEDSPSWRQSFMELPERNGNPFLEGETSEVGEAAIDSFLREATHRADTVKVEGEMRLLNTEKLADNFMFLKDHNMMRDGSGFSSTVKNFLSPGIAHEPEERFKMSSWNNLEILDSSDLHNEVDACSKPAASSTSLREDLLDPSKTSLEQFCQSLLENETPVPSITVITENTTSNQLLIRTSSSIEALDPLQSSNRGTDSGFDSKSETFDVIFGKTHGHNLEFSESTITDSLCTDAKIPSLEDDLETSKHSAEPMGSHMPINHVHALSLDNRHSDDLTNNDLLSELTEDADTEMEATLSDQEEAFIDTNGDPHVKSSLLVSGPSLDQISQDSLLEDSMSHTLPTVDNSAETPDSLNSLDIHRFGEQGEEPNAQVTQHKLQPPYKISDSGYETENLESPEWNFQPNVKDHSPLKNGISVAEEEEEMEKPTAVANLVPPEIVISEVEGLIDTHSEDPGEGWQPDRVDPPEELTLGGNYRDSAYFSDNESESEKKSEETTAGGSAEVSWLSTSPEETGGTSDGLTKKAGDEREAEFLLSEQEASLAAETHRPEAPTERKLPRADLLIADQHEPEVDTGDNDERLEAFKEETFGEQSSEHLDVLAPLSSSLQSAVHTKLTRTYATDGHKLKEPDMEGRYLARREGLGLDGQVNDMDADEEDENSDDSDDDVHAYQPQSSSSESEDDTVHAVPLIVSDDNGAKNLKSLLKPTTLNIEASSCPLPEKLNADAARRAVSFFDDVTVYLFDQVKFI